MTISYNLGIPATNNNPSVDQPNMQANNDAIAQYVAVDHINFGDAHSGVHKQVQMPIRGGGTGTIPPGLFAGEGTLYTKTSGETELFYTPDDTSDEYQLTRTITASKTLFATNTNYQLLVPPKPSITGGWTFLPGGMMLQYGQATNASLNTNNQIVFPVAFTSFVSSVTVTPIRNNTDDKVVAILTGSLSLTGFLLELSSSSKPTGVCWMAIGI